MKYIMRGREREKKNAISNMAIGDVINEQIESGHRGMRDPYAATFFLPFFFFRP